MAAVTSIQSELKNLGAASKRHNSELAQSVSRSLSILEAASQSYDSDQSAIYSLRKYNDLVTPFILACSEASAKSCASALQCIQTLATFKGIAPSRLHELLQALMEATQLGLGIQLKILQVLPVILHEFAADLSGEEIVELLQVCAVLLEGNKVAMVHNAAYATLQQLITGVFDRTDMTKETDPENQPLTRVDVSTTVSFEVPPRLYDSMMIMLDLCNFAERLPPQFLKIKDLSMTFTLELLELTLSNQADLIHEHEEFAAILRFRVTTLLLRLFSEAIEFPIVLRVVRIFYLLLRQHLDILTTESEVILSTLASTAKNGVDWKRAVCVEVLQGIVLEVHLLYQIYEKFDAVEGRTNIIGCLASLFSEALSDNHGLMLATDMSTSSLEKASGRSHDVSEGEGDAPQDDAEIVLSKHCSPNIPVIEMLDRVDPPSLTPQYVYYLIIKCSNFLTDDVHRLVSTEEEDSTDILDSLSSPLLVCHSATLSIAMDMELFRSVVRSVQRLAHAAGIVKRVELRDEFIRLLIQHCHLPKDNENKPWVIQRCSLCVRALFNLGYALGNQLGPSWNLLTSVIFGLGQDIGAENANLDAIYGNSEPEYRTINLSLKKLLESTTHLDNQALIHFIRALGSSDRRIKFSLLEFIANINSARFGDPDSLCWETFAEILLNGIKNSENASIASSTLNDTALAIMEVSVSQDQSSDLVDRSLGMVLGSVCAEVKADETEIRVKASEHINMLLDKFGAKIYNGWVYVFDYIAVVPGSDDFSLMHSTFRTVELICSDFLDNLPYPRVFNLTLCLDEFARQQIDLNTAFTATSLFWSVCDHLMKGENVGEDMDPSAVSSGQQLIDVAQDYNSPSKRFALWLFAVLKLATISGNVSQQQVRTSAIQIFLRLFNTHGSQLPNGVWDVAIRLVIPSILNANAKLTYDTLSEIQESHILLIDGLTKIITQFFSQLNTLPSFSYFLEQWISFLKNSVEYSPKISRTVYKDLIEILEADGDHYVSRSAISDFWVSQNLRPKFSADEPRATADALSELVNLYPFVEGVVDVSHSLKVLSSCALFPYFTSPDMSSEHYQMSTLQWKATSRLGQLEKHVEPGLVAEILVLLNQMALSPIENELNSEKPNFRGISMWAQDNMIQVIGSLKSPVASEIIDVSPTVARSMNRILRAEEDLKNATQIIIKLLEMASDLKTFDSQTITESFQLILGSTDGYTGENPVPRHIKEVIDSANKFLDVLRAKDLDLSTWREVLKTLLGHSILYERSNHNRKYYEEDVYDSGKELQYGSVEPALQIHHKQIAFFCLQKLLDLGTESKLYSVNAQKLFVQRVTCVLNQYIGDCRILGGEPLRRLVHDELLFVLTRLVISTSDNLALDPYVHGLVLKSLSRAHRDVLPLLEKILLNINKTE